MIKKKKRRIIITEAVAAKIGYEIDEQALATKDQRRIKN